MEAVIGVDSRPPRATSPKLRPFLHDITQPLGGLFEKEGVDSVIHLAFTLKPARDKRSARRVNVDGTAHVLRACQGSGVDHVLYLSSTAAYGAHRDNPVPLTEESPLRPNPRFQYSREKAETEGLFQAFAASNPQVAVTVLRGCVTMGPSGAGSIGSRVFQPLMIRLAGHDPPVQYLHEEDLVALLVMALEQRPPGVFNVAGDGPLRYSDLARLAKRPMLALPGPLLAALMDFTWALRLQSQSDSAGLDFIAYPWVAGNEKLKHQTGFAYGYSSQETVLAYLRRARVQ